MASISEEYAEQEVYTEQVYHHIFQSVDVGQDGYVDESDLAQALSNHGLADSQDSALVKARELMPTYDQDRDGRWSESEFRASIQHADMNALMRKAGGSQSDSSGREVIFRKHLVREYDDAADEHHARELENLRNELIEHEEQMLEQMKAHYERLLAQLHTELERVDGERRDAEQRASTEDVATTKARYTRLMEELEAELDEERSARHRAEREVRDQKLEFHAYQQTMEERLFTAQRDRRSQSADEEDDGLEEVYRKRIQSLERQLAETRELLHESAANQNQPLPVQSSRAPEYTVVTKNVTVEVEDVEVEDDGAADNHMELSALREEVEHLTHSLESQRRAQTVMQTSHAEEVRELRERLASQNALNNSVFSRQEVEDAQEREMTRLRSDYEQLEREAATLRIEVKRLKAQHNSQTSTEQREKSRFEEHTAELEQNYNSALDDIRRLSQRLRDSEVALRELQDERTREQEEAQQQRDRDAAVQREDVNRAHRLQQELDAARAENERLQQLFNEAQQRQQQGDLANDELRTKSERLQRQLDEAQRNQRPQSSELPSDAPTHEVKIHVTHEQEGKKREPPRGASYSPLKDRTQLETDPSTLREAQDMLADERVQNAQLKQDLEMLRRSRERLDDEDQQLLERYQDLSDELSRTQVQLQRLRHRYEEEQSQVYVLEDKLNLQRKVELEQRERIIELEAQLRDRPNRATYIFGSEREPGTLTAQEVASLLRDMRDGVRMPHDEGHRHSRHSRHSSHHSSGQSSRHASPRARHRSPSAERGRSAHRDIEVQRWSESRANNSHSRHRDQSPMSDSGSDASRRSRHSGGHSRRHFEERWEIREQDNGGHSTALLRAEPQYDQSYDSGGRSPSKFHIVARHVSSENQQMQAQDSPRAPTPVLTRLPHSATLRGGAVMMPSSVSVGSKLQVAQCSSSSSNNNRIQYVSPVDLNANNMTSFVREEHEESHTEGGRGSGRMRYELASGPDYVCRSTPASGNQISTHRTATVQRTWQAS
ncbi:uncharacterized protein MONBRDRAFT_27932 [Monosiga brevicollis MX1]|uniref:EF-hand domain-containing protein n=1 Tax=Monosiga brevicollis TaxID=81824 RepID=A9V6G1_MONBE|nr:uncharacterized protein MONBRDRAFT_27932 [Monosiga brevicollis MX1]EDQ86877.1 predicted protein [Monosiga brevicollis MX1]|eukprot:XP_001748422.1 hypothetical protein [Monosiga brevicollis MX1]